MRRTFDFVKLLRGLALSIWSSWGCLLRENTDTIMWMHLTGFYIFYVY